MLRPGGALAIWWNDADSGVPWIAEQEERLRVFFGAQGENFRTLPQGLGAFTTRTVRWSRRITLDAHLANLASHSAFLMLGEAGTRAYFAEERALLAPLFPDGTVEEQYVVSLSVALV